MSLFEAKLGLPDQRQAPVNHRRQRRCCRHSHNPGNNNRQEVRAPHQLAVPDFLEGRGDIIYRLTATSRLCRTFSASIRRV